MNNRDIFVTSPLFPSLDEYKKVLDDIWERKYLTNNGFYHKELEKKLSAYLGVDYLSLFTNGTLPLIAAFQVLDLHRSLKKGETGEVITSAYSFVATTHAIWWNNLEPVFVDVEEETGNMDPEKIEAAITGRTVAIMPVHVYGNPCDVERIERIAEKHNLKVIYDAAHAFGVTINGRSVLEWGDVSSLSFHATKVYNTVEGGALICHSADLKKRIDNLRNFGFSGETAVDEAGINSKMDELRSAFGLLNLEQVDSAIENRKKIADYYREKLTGTKGLRFLKDKEGVRHNYAYFPVFIDEGVFGMTRDELFEKLKQNGIFARRYFYPSISEFAPYGNAKGAGRSNLPNTYKLSESVICLPIYAGLEISDAERVVKIIRWAK